MPPAASTDGPPFELSPDCRTEVALAIAAYASSRAVDGTTRMRHAAVRVSDETLRAGVDRAQMVLAIKRLFERAPRISGDVQKRVEAFDLFVAQCVDGYVAGGGAR